MSKQKFVAAVVGLVAVVGAGTAALGVEATPRAVTPPAQAAEPGAQFSVTYSPCFFFEEVVTFVFRGTSVDVPCVIPVTPDIPGGVEDLQPQGFRSLPAETPPPGSATTSFTAPTEAGVYTGVAYVEALQLQGFRRPAAESLAHVGGRLTQASSCVGLPDTCRAFTVTVVAQQPPSTETTATAAPTTIAPTTTAAAVSPAAVATAPQALPATGPSQNDNTATIAIVFLVAGGALLLMSRRRAAN